MLEIDWTLFVQMIWLVLAWIFLSRLLFKPILRLLELRQSRTAGAAAEASKLNEEAQMLLSQIEERLRQARHEASVAYQSSREKTHQEGRKIIEEARRDAEALKEESRQALEKEVAALRKEIDSQAEELVPFVVSKVLPSSLLLFMLLPLPAWAAGGEEGSLFTLDFLFAWLNFALLVFFLWKVVGPRLREFLKERRQSIQEAIGSSQKALDEARRTMQELQGRLEVLEAEVEKIKETVFHQAERERRRVLEQARQTAERMIAEARELIEAERLQLRSQVRRELVDRVIWLAEREIERRLETEEAQSRWFTDWVGRLKTVQML